MPPFHRDPTATGFLRDFRAVRKAELHLHLEGSISAGTLVRLSRRFDRPLFPDIETVRSRRQGLCDAGTFLTFYGDICRQLRNPADYAALARDVVRRLVRERIAYAEVYVSPAIVERLGFAWQDVIAQLEPVFAGHEQRRFGRVRILLDSVRQWGPAAAHRVLDLHQRHPWPRAIGFGLGGDECALPAGDFAGVYRRLDALGLAPLVHAGEWGDARAVADALEHLRPVRIAHGVRAAEDPALVKRLAREGVTLDLCLVSNELTGVVPDVRSHTALSLLRAGVRLTLSTDDPGLFGTTLRKEYVRMASLGASGAELRALAAASLSSSIPALRRRWIGPAHRAKGTAKPSRRR